MKLETIKKQKEVTHFSIKTGEEETWYPEEFKELEKKGNNLWYLPINNLKPFWKRYQDQIIPSPEILTYAVFAGIIEPNLDNEKAIIIGDENLRPLEITSERLGYEKQYQQLMHHQKIGAVRILQRDAILIADMMGLGKTLTALYGISIDPSIKRTFVVCPSTLKYVWQKEIHQWFPNKTISIVDGNAKERWQQYSAGTDFIVVSYDLIRRPEDQAMIKYLQENGSYEYSFIQGRGNKIYNLPIYPNMKDSDNFEYTLEWEVKKGKKVIEVKQLVLEYKGEYIYGKKQDALKFDAIVLDEAHRIKNPTSQQTQIVHQFTEIPKRILLTGTPLMNNVEELWSLLHFINPYKFSNYWAFRNKYCIMKEITTKATGRKIKLVVGYKNLDYLQKQIAGLMLRRTKADTLKELPPKTYETRYIELSKEQWKIYNDLNDEIAVWLEESEKEIQVHQALDKMLRLKQVAISPELLGGTDKSSKLDELEEIVEEITESGEKVLIFSQFKTATDIIVKRLKKKGYKNIAYISGDVPMKVSDEAIKKGKTDRMEEVRKLQEDDDCQIFVGVIDACKEGITLTSASYVIFVDKKWTPADNAQTEDRAHRKGQVNPVTIISLVAKNTIEEYIEETLKDKMDLFDQVVEGAVSHQNTLREVKRMLSRK